MTSKFRRRLALIKFTLSAAISAACLVGLILFAIYDSVSSAKTSEEQYRKSTLSAELSNFLLTVREPDGSSLLENTKDFSYADRPLVFVSLHRPFYSYLLNRANAGSVVAEKIYWESPRPCIVEFSAKNIVGSNDSPFVIQTCFALVPSEAAVRIRWRRDPIAIKNVLPDIGIIKIIIYKQSIAALQLARRPPADALNPEWMLGSRVYSVSAPIVLNKTNCA